MICMGFVSTPAARPRVDLQELWLIPCNTPYHPDPVVSQRAVAMPRSSMLPLLLVALLAAGALAQAAATTTAAEPTYADFGCKVLTVSLRAAGCVGLAVQPAKCRSAVLASFSHSRPPSNRGPPAARRGLHHALHDLQRGGHGAEPTDGRGQIRCLP